MQSETDKIASFLIITAGFSVAINASFAKGMDIMRQIAIVDHRTPSYLSSKISPGDVIACKIISTTPAIIYGAEHAMLAVSSQKVVHAMADADQDAWGKVMLENFTELAKAEGYTLCRIATAEYDRAMMQLGFSPKDVFTAVKSAKMDARKEGYYSQYDCNCEHWITHWKYGAAWSFQSNQPPCAKCPLQNCFKNGVRAGASSYSQNLQLSVMSMAVAGEWKGANGVANGKAIGPNAGAHAELGVHNTGVGFKSGLGEVTGKVGQFGATLGLNIDSGLGVGRDGVNTKVLGTGFTVSATAGISVCVFGTCLHIG